MFESLPDVLDSYLQSQDVKREIIQNGMVAEHLLNTSSAPRSVPNSCPLTKSTNLVIRKYDWWTFAVIAKLYSFLIGNFQDQCTKITQILS